jgi:23S rRNA (pseudouridine1915-N3)-methyltransferase
VKLWIVSVGRPGRLLAEAIAEYERRAERYWTLEVVHVRESPAGRNVAPEQVRSAEGERLLKRVPRAAEIIALTRTGDAWSSTRLAAMLAQHANRSSAGAAFLIGGAFGLSDEVLRDANRRMRLSTFTLPHDLARLMLAEQLYRAGTIVRGEPYHKGGE